MLIDREKFSFTSPRGFIALEGVNGAGKSTLQRNLAEYLQGLGREVVSTYEPGDTRLGKELRAILLEHKVDPPMPLTEVFLFCADRHEHVKRVIEPALEARKLVLCDRFYYSTLAFQGYGRKLNLSVLTDLSRLAIDGVCPDLVILLDLDPQAGLERNRGASQGQVRRGQDAFEKEKLDFHKRLREGFLTVAESLPEPFLVIDASRDSKRVFEEVRMMVDKLLAGYGTGANHRA
jgi:dTMP kinase